MGLVAGCAASPPPIEEFDAAQLAVVDTYVRSSVPEARWGSEPGLIVGGWGDTYEALIRFDVTDLPTLAANERAMLLLLNTSTSPGQQPTDVQLTLLTSNFANDINWNGAQLLAGQPKSVVGIGGFNAWTEIDISEAVRAWQGGAPNNGLRLTPVQTDNRFDVFVSSDAPDIAHRPSPAPAHRPPAAMMGD